MSTLDQHVVSPAEGSGAAAEVCAARPRSDDRGLLLVGLFKLSKAIFFSAVGAGALHLIHHSLGDTVMRLVDSQRFIDPEGHFAGLIMDKADLVGHHQLREAGLLSFLYAFLCVVEGSGLMLRKVWAEYFTTILTAAFLPWESYELIAKFAPYKVLFLVVNLVVLFYLLWVLKKKRERDGLGMGTA